MPAANSEIDPRRARARRRAFACAAAALVALLVAAANAGAGGTTHAGTAAVRAAAILSQPSERLGAGTPRQLAAARPAETAIRPRRGALAAVPYRADPPTNTTLYQDGPSGRYLLGGAWLFRFDGGVGLKRHFERSAATAGWSGVTVPNAWNVNDTSAASFRGTVAWYRKDFVLPMGAPALAWIVRFESVNYSARIWLNGHEIGRHSGSFLPFELALPANLLNRGGANRLVLRIDDRHSPSSFPPGSGNSLSGHGGWWNYGGITREVYLRQVDRVDFAAVQVLPQLPCPTCAATIVYRVTIRNYAPTAQTVNVTSNFGTQPLSLGSATIAAGASHTFVAPLTVPTPVLWYPSSPYLYDVTLDATANGTAAAHYELHSGIRSIQVVGGQLLLNGQHLNYRGVGLHEQAPGVGSALSNADRARIIGEVKTLGATVVRAHYPLDPELYELGDQQGVMFWSEIPVYSMQSPILGRPAERAAAVNMLRTNILANGNHPSVITWSVANELNPKPNRDLAHYFGAATATAHALDPTRPVAVAINGYPGAPCSRAYAPFDVLGLNDYFGWYTGPSGSIADGDLLSAYLDRMRRCFPTKGLVVSEFGAEANRHGPPEIRGTYEYQQNFVDSQLALLASKPWLSGAIYWALEEFYVHPGWSGGNPQPNPPLFQKGLLTYAGHAPKPAWFDVQRSYQSTPQLTP